MDQLFIENMETKDISNQREEYAYNLIKPALENILSNENFPKESLFLKQNKTDKAQHSSVCLFKESNILFRISFRGKKYYISIPSKYEHLVPDDVEYKKAKAEQAYFSIFLSDENDLKRYSHLLESVLEEMLISFPTDFGCCSQYNECSDAKKCVNPDPEMAIRCTYRKNLKNGKIFYGKNRNI